MTIVMTTLIVLLCFVGTVVALLLIDNEKYRQPKWKDGERDMPGQRFHSHVEQGPDSLYPAKVTRDGTVNQSGDKL